MSKLFVALGLVLGCGYVFVTPPLQVPDEYSHFVRAFSLSEGVCVAGPGGEIPSGVRQLARVYPPGVQNARLITVAELRTMAAVPLDRSERIPRAYSAVNMYSCVLYAPAATAMLAGRLARFSSLNLMYAGRFANLVAFIVLVCVALRIMPGFRPAIAAVALMPTALHQAASLSGDSFALAVSFLLCSLILKVAFGGQETLSKRDHFLIAAVAVLLALSKFTLSLIPMALLIPAAKFGGFHKRIGAVTVYMLLAFTAATLWQSANNASLYTAESDRLNRGIDMAANARFLFEEPVKFAGVVGRSIEQQSYTLLRQLVGVFGRMAVYLPASLVLLYLGLLLLTTHADTDLIALRFGQRMLLAFIVIGSVLGLFALMWVALTSRNTVEFPGSAHVPGLQGRYFIPLVLPLLLLLSGRRFRLNARHVALAVCLIALTANGVAVAMVSSAFYAPSSSTQPDPSVRIRAALQDALTTTSKYEGKIVRQAGQTPDEQRVYFVIGGRRSWILDGRWLAENGFQMSDVVVIEPTELTAIPPSPSILITWTNPGELIPRLEGRLVRSSDQALDDAEVYLVRDGKRHLVPSRRWIEERGFWWPADGIALSRAILDGIPLGEALDPTAPR